MQNKSRRRNEMKMTLKTALEILIESAERDLTGAGMGFRSIPIGEKREKVEQAIKRAQEYIWGGRR
jgi:hypothetical protein